MIRDEDDVDDISEVARFEGGVQVFSEDVNLGEGFLGLSIIQDCVVRVRYITYIHECGVGPGFVSCLVERRFVCCSCTIYQASTT